MNFKQTLLTVTAAAGLFAAGSLAANADTVTVKPGDTVSGIALAHHTTVKAIEKANKLADVNFILPGQKLEIDKKGNVKVVEQPQTQAVAQAPAQTQVAQQAPVQQAAQPVAQYQAPVQQYQAPVVKRQAPAAPAQNNNVSGSEASAKNAIGNMESGNRYNARNGQFIGKYQLSSSYLNGDYSAANQERVANSYVNSRYGSWANALKFHQQNGWY